MTEKKNNLEGIRIEIKDNSVALGNFSNAFSINFTNSEFVIDFIMMQPQARMGIVGDRIIMTPDKVRDFYKALGEAIKAFESVTTSTDNDMIV